MKTRLTLYSMLALLLFSCAGSEELSVSEQRANSAFKLYKTGKEAVKDGNFQRGVTYFEQLDNLFPFGAYAEEAQLNLIYCYHRLGNHVKASAVADRFIRQNPHHKNLDYAHYMKGLANFSAEINRPFDADLQERDTSNARQAFDDFAQLLRLFPDSKYAKDAQLRMIYLRNRLAEQELYVANYYMQREAYQAAAARAKYVVDHYPKTTSTPYALKLMVVAYELLGLNTLAENSRRVLLLNYPDFKQ